jgi:hypothetical protein
MERWTKANRYDEIAVVKGNEPGLLPVSPETGNLMIWTSTRTPVAAVIVALPAILVALLMVAALPGAIAQAPGPGAVGNTASAGDAKPVIPPSTGLPKATNAVLLNVPLDMPATRFAADRTYAFAGIPGGFQTSSNVDVRIDGVICLWGLGDAQQRRFRDQVTGIPVNQKLDSLYVYHAAFYVSPDKTPVYDLVFRYEDGSSVTNEIQYGTHVFDWYSPPNSSMEPSGSDSIVAWRGTHIMNSGALQSLRFCLTEFKNPHPSVPVLCIDLYSCKNQSTACIGAMTTGPSGLVLYAKVAKEGAF